MDLIVVESPTKARTLTKFLGDKARVLATVGHIRDLPEKTLGVKIDTKAYDFELEYVQTSKQKQAVKEIIDAVKTADRVILATDPDREGEAIAWHVFALMQKAKDKKQKIKRISFHEITEKAVNEALKKPGEINMPLVDAQQARRVIDRLVGYKISPLLWAKVRKGLSAGRVQSVAVRLICEKEKEIEGFNSEEYWDILVDVKPAEKEEIFTIKLISIAGDKIKIGNGDFAEKICHELRSAIYKVTKVDKKDFKRSPPAPFTTSSLQQTSVNRFGWTAKRTMQVAQSLYEQGYITYHRTDSTNISIEAGQAARVFLIQNYGQKYALDKPRIFKTKSKVAQEAHEAIRPTEVGKTVESQSGALNKDQEKLYELIWKRFLASQMTEVLGETIKVEVGADKYRFEVRGETIYFDGWYKVNMAWDEEVESASRLPELWVGEDLNFVELKSEQKFTQPPARYNEASLIKKLEEMGIGRPSTYAPTLSTIQDRQYVEKVEKRLRPTSLGVAANEFLTANFSDVLDYNFTAKMEDDLDEIANGRHEWKKTVMEFWMPLGAKIDTVKERAERVKVEVETTGDKCPKCQEGDIVVRIGKFGRFLACSRFPECDYKANYVNKIGVACPKCGGDVIMRKTRSHKNFYGCSNYPNCDFASWNKPK